MSARQEIASRIEELLRKRHDDDVFISQCKDGPSWTGHLRMDAWVMRRSWSKPCVWGYEIKSSRADFLSDDKWHAYLPCCNRFAFVCPHGEISPDELPAEVGVLWMTRTGSRLIAKRKPVHRDVTIPEEMFRYILMSRAEIVPPRLFGRGVDDTSDREWWRQWMEQKRIDHRFGRRVSSEVSRRLAEEITRVRAENERLAERIGDLEKASEALEALGVPPVVFRRADPARAQEIIREKLEQAREAIPDDLLSDLVRLSNIAGSLKKRLEEIDRR